MVLMTTVYAWKIAAQNKVIDASGRARQKQPAS